MSIVSRRVRRSFGKSDRKRDEGLTTPDDIKRFDDICYGKSKRNQVLDVYRPKKETGILPVIVNVHGGGWVYGNKEVYQYYCMSLAQRGFAVVNFTYRLAPEYKYPAGMEDINLVFAWVLENAQIYGFDTHHIFAVGDSAGGHMLSLYSCILTNQRYQDMYSFQVPKNLELCAIALNCGKYAINEIDENNHQQMELLKELLPEQGTREEREWISPVLHMTKDFPPAYIMTATGDMLKDEAPKIVEQLKKNRVEYRYKIYGTEENLLPHVFHCNIRSEDAKECNDEECNFFKEFL